MKVLSQKVKGIALFQVLLITAVISILAIQFTQTARNQLSIAGTIVDRVEAQALLRSVESELLFALTTEPWKPNGSVKNDYAKVWNFYGKEFVVNRGSGLAGEAIEGNIKIQLQDQSGLLSLYGGYERPRFEALLRKLAEHKPEELALLNFNKVGQTSILANSLKDWQDSDDFVLINGAESQFYESDGMPTNLPLQTYQELINIRGFTQRLLDAMWPYTTIRSQPYFNPMLAPELLMETLLSKERLDEIIRLRKLGELTGERFESLSGIEADETTMFFHSGLLRGKLTVIINQVVLEKWFEVHVKPYDKHPYIEYEIKI